MNHCKDCNFFRLGYFRHGENGIEILPNTEGDDFGMCLHRKVYSDIVDSWMKLDVVEKSNDGIYAESYDGYANLEVGINFGCIHWSEKEGS